MISLTRWRELEGIGEGDAAVGAGAVGLGVGGAVAACTWVAVVVLAGCCPAATPASAGSSVTSSPGVEVGRVVSVADGDTLTVEVEVEVDGERARVRVLGIDAPVRNPLRCDQAPDLRPSSVPGTHTGPRIPAWDNATLPRSRISRCAPQCWFG